MGSKQEQDEECMQRTGKMDKSVICHHTIYAKLNRISSLRLSHNAPREQECLTSRLHKDPESKSHNGLLMKEEF